MALPDPGPVVPGVLTLERGVEHDRVFNALWMRISHPGTRVLGSFFTTDALLTQSREPPSPVLNHVPTEHTIMVAIHETAYPRFKYKSTKSEIRSLYSPSEAEQQWMRGRRLDPDLQQAHIVYLKCFQRLGYFPSHGDIPRSVREHIANSISTLKFAVVAEARSGS